MAARRVLVTDEDMARLRGLLAASRRSARRDQSHLAELERELDRADVIPAGEVPPDVVTMHSVVGVRDLDTDVRTVYRLVFPVDADIERRRISVLAPVGTALIGYRAGDRIDWATPGGTRRLEIESVVSQPEAAVA
jgi:regulator of nucleoside diphosphate kinase